MFRFKSILIISVIVFFLCSCSDDENTPKPADSNYNMLVLNEGNFGWGFASLTGVRVQGNSFQADQDVFQGINGFKLGNVGNDMLIKDDRLYIVINNSGRITVCDANNLSFLYNVEGFESPRNIHFSNNNFWVTDIYKDVLYRLTEDSKVIEEEINLSGYTENMLSWTSDKILITQQYIDGGTESGDKIYIFNTLTRQIERELNTGLNPGSLVFDHLGKLWVLCSGGLAVDTPRLMAFNSSLDSVVFDRTFPIDQSPAYLSVSPDKRKLYFFNDGLFKMAVNDTLPQKINGLSGQTVNHMVMHPIKEEIYVCDAKNYLERGVVRVYDSSGVYLSEFKTGIIPRTIKFVDP